MSVSKRMKEMNLKKALGYAVFAAILGATSAVQAGPNAGTDVEVSGIVSENCAVTTEEGLAGNFSLGQILNDDGSLKDNDFEKVLGGVSCNYLAKLSIKTATGNLKNGSLQCDVTPPYLTCLNYTAYLEWGGQSAMLHVDGTAGDVSAPEQMALLHSGDLKLLIKLDPVTQPILAGTYSDTLKVQVGAPL